MNLAVIHNSSDMREWSLGQMCAGRKIGLVPTMGALHAGHRKLVERAAELTDMVVVSIFVNPTQFGPGEDLDAYPRQLDEDLRSLDEQGLAAVVFAPEVNGLYPTSENKTWVTVDDLGKHLCGASRPGHFRGVTTVVSRLLTVINPDFAFFGMKDAQQYFILKRMALEMGFRTRLIGIPTVRESDGLALSSRNRYLTPAERSESAALSRAVFLARTLIEESGETDPEAVLSAMKSALDEATTGRTDYVALVDSDNLQPVSSLQSGLTVLAAVAAYFGKARLIDNALIRVP